jgi:hypothetical protein
MTSKSSHKATGDSGWERRKRLAEVFGDVLPETTRDERDDESAREAADRKESATDAWLRAQVPPHHGS